MVNNQPALDLHDFNDVHLIPVRSLPRIFPNQCVACAERVLLTPLAHWHTRRVGRRTRFTSLIEKSFDAITPPNNSALLLQHDGYKRRFENGILSVQ